MEIYLFFTEIMRVGKMILKIQMEILKISLDLCRKSADNTEQAQLWPSAHFHNMLNLISLFFYVSANDVTFRCNFHSSLFCHKIFLSKMHAYQVFQS